MEIRITKSRAAMAALFLLAGVGLSSLLSPLVGTALATAGQIVNISDRSGSPYFAKVDAGGKLAVGDGAGPLSVDGTITDRPAAPASPWRASLDIQGAQKKVIAGPSLAPINVTSLSLSTSASSASNVQVILSGGSVASSATTCSAASGDLALWQGHYGTGASGVAPLSFTFPTPLQWKPPANTKACLFAVAATTIPTTMNAVGFYGG